MRPERSGVEEGSVLVMVLMAIAALLILGGALSALSLTEGLIARNQEQDAKLYYIAEAGIEAGVAALGCARDHESPLSGCLGGGGYSVQIVPAPGLPENHPYHEHIPQRLLEGQRLVVSEGSLKGRFMVMAVIVEAGENGAGALPGEFDEGHEESDVEEGVVIAEWINPWRL